MRTGLYPEGSAAQGQILRLSRYRAARIGVDVNLHTGKWTFEQAVKYFMEAGGLDREAADRAKQRARHPQSDAEDQLHHRQMADHEFAWANIRIKMGANFRFGQFHDDLVKNGSLPVSIIEWILLDDPSTIEAVLK